MMVTSCSICSCAVELHLVRTHEAWHRNMSNIPPRSDDDVRP